MGEMADDLYDLMMIQDLNYEMEFENRFNNNIWTTKNGREIPLNKMSDSHLQNAIQYVEAGHTVYGIGKAWLPKLEQELTKRLSQLETALEKLL